MGVILIAHAEIKRFDSPETEPYDRYQPKLHRSASALVQEHVDAVLFANYRISTLKSDVGFNKKVVRGVSGGDRLLHTAERPAFLAKNRFGLAETLPLSWPELAAGIPFYASRPARPRLHPRSPELIHGPAQWNLRRDRASTPPSRSRCCRPASTSRI